MPKTSQFSAKKIQFRDSKNKFRVGKAQFSSEKFKNKKK